MQGYVGDSYAKEMMQKVGRVVTEEGIEYIYKASIAEIQSMILSNRQKNQQMAIPSLSGDQAYRTAASLAKTIIQTSKTTATLEGIVSRVLSIIHDFAVDVYYSRTFDMIAEGIFESYKKEIDLLISKNLGSIIEKIPVVVSKLSDNQQESVSHALTTCRRIIDSFADHVYPPQDQTIDMDGQQVSLKSDKVLNRINAFVRSKISSDSRRTRIRQNLSNLYSRVSAGVHSDVDAVEAKNLFFNVYLVLGEILSLNIDAENQKSSI